MTTITQLVRKKLNKGRRTRRVSKMARRRFGRIRRFGRRRSGGGGGFGLGKVTGVFRMPIVQKTALALGIGTITALLASKVAPQYTSPAAVIGEFVGGGVVGVVGAELVKTVAGVPSAFGSILGGFGGNSNNALYSAGGAA